MRIKCEMYVFRSGKCLWCDYIKRPLRILNVFSFTGPIHHNCHYVCVDCGSIGRLDMNEHALIPLSNDEFIQLGHEISLVLWESLLEMQIILKKYDPPPTNNNLKLLSS